MTKTAATRSKKVSPSEKNNAIEQQLSSVAVLAREIPSSPRFTSKSCLDERKERRCQVEGSDCKVFAGAGFYSKVAVKGPE